MEELNLVPLMEIGSQWELVTMQGALEENEIPYILKDREMGGYMRLIYGSYIYGVEIVVEEKDYEKAKEIAIMVLGPQRFSED